MYTDNESGKTRGGGAIRKLEPYPPMTVIGGGPLNSPLLAAGNITQNANKRPAQCTHHEVRERVSERERDRWMDSSVGELALGALGQR